MTNNCQRINIAVKLPRDIFGEVIELSNEISKDNDAYFALDGSNFIPHITLYSPEYPSENIDKVLNTASQIIKNTLAFTARFTEIRSHFGYIDIALGKTEEWIDLHERIVNELNPLRDGHLREKYLDSEELKQYTNQQQEYIKKYGYPEVLNSFTPHLTVGRLRDEVLAKEVARSLDFPFKDFQVTHLAAFTMGDHGTCNGLIKEWSLA